MNTNETTDPAVNETMTGNPEAQAPETAAAATEETNPKEEKKSADPNKVNKKIKRREKGVKQYQFFILRVLILLVVLWVLFFKVIGLTQMPSGDMYPRVDNGDFVMFYRLDTSPKAQDLIVYEKVDSEGKTVTMISRVIAVPGDKVEFTEEGNVIVNGNTLIESNIYYRGTQYRGATAPTYPLKLGEGEYFVLGDRRDQAFDSRAFGPVKADEILGVSIAILRRNAL